MLRNWVRVVPSNSVSFGAWWSVWALACSTTIAAFGHRGAIRFDAGGSSDAAGAAPRRAARLAARDWGSPVVLLTLDGTEAVELSGAWLTGGAVAAPLGNGSRRSMTLPPMQPSGTMTSNSAPAEVCTRSVSPATRPSGTVTCIVAVVSLAAGDVDGSRRSMTLPPMQPSGTMTSNSAPAEVCTRSVSPATRPSGTATCIVASDDGGSIKISFRNRSVSPSTHTARAATRAGDRS